jgi:hypothetical protein
VLVSLVVNGPGFIYIGKHHCSAALCSAKLTPIPKRFMPEPLSWYLYFNSRRQSNGLLSSLIQHLDKQQPAT